MELIKKYLNASAKEQNIKPVKLIYEPEYIYTEKFIVRFFDNIISNLYVHPDYRRMGLCGLIIHKLTQNPGEYYVDIPKDSNNYEYLVKKFESLGFKNGKLTRKLTYFINQNNSFDKTVLFKLMKDFIRFETVPKYADLIIIEHPGEEYNKIPCRLRSYISDISAVTNKSNLYENLPELCPKTVFIKQDTKITNVKVKYPVIVKGTDDWCNGGASNQVCLNDEELYNYIFNNPGNNFIAQEYIINIDLFMGLKYHLRMYLMVKFYDPSEWRLMRRFKLITAKKKYDKNLIDKDSQDTHFRSTAKDYTDLDLPKNKAEKFYNQAIKISEKIYELIKDKRDEVDSFYIFGLDLMPDNKGKLILLECNSHIGLNNKNDESVMANYYYTDIYNFIIKDYFNKKITKPIF